MTLLQEIQEACTNQSVDILTLLRKCRILAARLKNDEFKLWVQRELDGYPNDVAIPEYRITAARSKGHFAGYAGSGMRNVDIPNSSIPERVRKNFETTIFREGVGPLLDLIKSGDSSFRKPWPADLIPYVGQDTIIGGMNLMQAWVEVSRGQGIEVIETVRNRILNFVLEIETMNPEAGESTTSNNPLPNNQVTQIFNHYISGNVGNLSSGSSNFQQTANMTIVNGDFDSLRKELKKLGIIPSDIDELESAVKSDSPPKDGKFGQRVSSWIGKMISKSAQSAWKVTTNVAADFLTKALCAYYGIPPQEF